MRNRLLLGGIVAAAPASGWAVKGGYQHAALLLDWARAICAYHAVPVHDFATSFADGYVMCLLVSMLTCCCELIFYESHRSTLAHLFVSRVAVHSC